MSGTEYLEISSAFRNRNEWIHPGEFQIPISQSGTKSQQTALDPVSLAVPLLSWTSNNLDKNNTSSLSGVINITSATITTATDPSTVIISCTKDLMQQLNNYYTGLVITITINISPPGYIYRRITSFKYLHKDSFDDFGCITLDSPFSDSVVSGAGFIIEDFSSVIDEKNPYFFVPGGSDKSNAYVNNILYNETRRQYRKIKYYESISHALSLITNDATVSTNVSGPLPTTWGVSDNYSIRKEAPYIPNLALTYPQAIIPTNSSVITVNILLNNTNYPDDFFKNYGIRIVPNPATPVLYNYPLNLPLNETTVISSSKYVSTTNKLTLNVYPPFKGLPAIGDLIELLPFNRDNFNPLVHANSIFSHPHQNLGIFEIELLNVIIPNQILDCASGGRLNNYPYIYVQLSNTSTEVSGGRHKINSNSPNSVFATFRVPVDDVPSLDSSSFFKLDGNGMVQTIKFKLNDNLIFKVTLQTGETFKTIIQDTINPFIVNELAQISALFCLRRLSKEH